MLAHIQNDEDRLDGSYLPNFIDSRNNTLRSAAQKTIAELANDPAIDLLCPRDSYPRLGAATAKPTTHLARDILESTNKNLADLELQRKEI